MERAPGVPKAVHARGQLAKVARRFWHNIVKELEHCCFVSCEFPASATHFTLTYATMRFPADCNIELMDENGLGLLQHDTSNSSYINVRPESSLETGKTN